MRTIPLLALLAGCYAYDPDPRWNDDRPVAAVVRTPISPASADAFRARMRSDVELWTTGLEALGCPRPFHYVEDAVDGAGLIILTSDPAEVPSGDAGLWWPGGSIYLRAEGDGTLDSYMGDPTWQVAAHELGHTLGLEHNAFTDSIMCESEQRIDLSVALPARDLRDAAASLGCGE